MSKPGDYLAWLESQYFTDHPVLDQVDECLPVAQILRHWRSCPWCAVRDGTLNDATVWHIIEPDDDRPAVWGEVVPDWVFDAGVEDGLRALYQQCQSDLDLLASERLWRHT